MSNSFVRVPEDGGGKRIDTGAVTVAGELVQRQRVAIASDADPDAVAPVQAQVPAPTDPGLTVRLAPGVQQDVNIADIAASLVWTLERLVRPIWMEPGSGRLRVVLDPVGGNQALATLTTLSNASTFSGRDSGEVVLSSMRAAWALNVRGRIS